MNCPNCNSDGESAFHSESFTCGCGEEMLFEYNICPDCGLMWRTVNGEVMPDSMVSYDDLMEPLNQSKKVVITEEELAVLKNMEQELMKVDKIEKGETTSMADYVHNCLKCGAVAHEVTPGRYQCGECEFEWEMIKFDE